MKESYIKLIIYLFFSSLLFILNDFIFKFLSQITINILLIILLITTYWIFGFEKDRHRYTKNIILEIIIVLITFFLLYYLSGIIIGYAKIDNYYNINSIIKIILPLIIYIILNELLRYQLLVKSSESKYLIYIVLIFFIIMDTTITLSNHTVGFNKETFLIIALTVLPSITENILCTYLSLNFGYKPAIVYLLIINLYSYLIPIIPNPNEYIYSLIFLLLPLYILKHIKKWLSKDRVNGIEDEDLNDKKNNIYGYIPLIITTIILVYFVSGYFKYYAIAIASGSMEPNISKGDVVIVNKSIKSLKEGDIIAYNYENKVVVHRIYKIINNEDEYYIYTKGDANESYDRYKIDKSMLIGTVKYKIPLIGYPTVLLNEIW